MPKYLTKEEAFAKCKKEGCFIPVEKLDIEKWYKLLRNTNKSSGLERS